MSSTYDVISVGSGHNALTAAGYLARAGKKVLVLERNPYPGGGVSTAELTEPGYLSERHSLLHAMILANPLITDDELGLLSDYGLEYIPLVELYGAIFDDETALPIYQDRARTIEAIARYSEKDAEAYDKFMDMAVAIAQMMLATLWVPPVMPETMIPMIRQSPLGEDILYSMSASLRDVVDDWFEDERLRVTIYRYCSEINLLHPEDKNTGILAYLAFGMLELHGQALPKKGGSSLTNALIRCIEDHGGEVVLNTTVEEVITKNGRAVGVRTAEGEELYAQDAVLAQIHPHLLDSMVDGLSPELTRAAKRTDLSSCSGFAIHAGLNETLKFKAGEDAGRITMNTLSTPSVDSLMSDFDELRRGRLPKNPLIGAADIAVIDPSRAPAGKGILHMFSMTTHDLADGGDWNAIADEYAESVLNRMGDFITNLGPSNLREMEYFTPLQHAIDTPSMQGGDIMGIAFHAAQSGGQRPTAALSQYAVPGADGLYLTGPFMHPGGGVIGGGRPTAVKMLQDFGIDFNSVLKK